MATAQSLVDWTKGFRSTNPGQDEKFYEQGIYGEAKNRGLSSAQIDKEFGLAGGTTAERIKSYGWDPLVSSYQQGLTPTGTANSDLSFKVGDGPAPAAPVNNGISFGGGKPQTQVPTVPQTQAPGGGIINSSIGSSDFLSKVNSTVGKDQLTSYQLDQLLAANSPYMQRAQALAAQAANSRGLINSSLGASAGTAAAIDAALPIAESDALAYRNRADAQQAADIELNRMGYGAQLDKEMADYKSELTKGEKQQEFDLQNVLNQNQYANERAIKLWEQQNLGYAQYIKGVADINATDMKPADKDAAIKRLWEQYEAGRPLASALRDIKIENGQIVSTAAGNTPGTGATPTAPVNPIMNVPTDTVVAVPAAVRTLLDMPLAQRNAAIQNDPVLGAAWTSYLNSLPPEDRATMLTRGVLSNGQTP